MNTGERMRLSGFRALLRVSGVRSLLSTGETVLVLFEDMAELGEPFETARAKSQIMCMASAALEDVASPSTVSQITESESGRTYRVLERMPSQDGVTVQWKCEAKRI
jgi:hypothetical protein